MFPSESLDWFRKHPLTATVAAVIAAAYSMAQYKTEELEEPCALKSNSNSTAEQRGITWSDEKGGALTEVIKANGDSPGPGFGDGENVYTAPDERLYGSSESIESFGPASSEESQSQRESGVAPQKVSSSGSSSGESSPNFGWFVSFTPPQKLYVKKEES